MGTSQTTTIMLHGHEILADDWFCLFVCLEKQKWRRRGNGMARILQHSALQHSFSRSHLQFRISILPHTSYHLGLHCCRLFYRAEAVCGRRNRRAAPVIQSCKWLCIFNLCCLMFHISFSLGGTEIIPMECCTFFPNQWATQACLQNMLSIRRFRHVALEHQSDANSEVVGSSG